MRLINGKKYLSAAEAAALLEVSARTVQRWVRRPQGALIGLLIYVHPVNGRIYFEEQSVMKLRGRMSKSERTLRAHA